MSDNKIGEGIESRLAIRYHQELHLLLSNALLGYIHEVPGGTLRPSIDRGWCFRV